MVDFHVDHGTDKVCSKTCKHYPWGYPENCLIGFGIDEKGRSRKTDNKIGINGEENVCKEGPENDFP